MTDGDAVVVDIGMRLPFRGISRRQALLWRGPHGWAEWSPFGDYTGAEIVPWLHAAREAADHGWPAPVRASVPVNCTIGVMPPDAAGRRAAASGCGTAKIKVADPHEDADADQNRVAAVRAALGPHGRIRVDANGAWDLDTAVDRLTRLARFDLEYAEQPVATVTELAELRVRLARAGVDVPIAADESIRRSGDPERVRDLHAADVAVLKAQPLGGVRRCLELAAALGMPVVVSSALETSIGLAAGVALAAALPDLPFACGLNTIDLLDGDVVPTSLRAEGGVIPVGPRPTPDPTLLAAHRADAATTDAWLARLRATQRLAAGASAADGSRHE